MNSVDKATETQISNIQKKTGLSLDKLADKVKQSGLTKHSEIRAMLIQELGLGYGDANTMTHVILKSDNSGAATKKTSADVLNEIYAGQKADLLPIHQKIMTAIEGFGEFEIAPKKGYVSLRRKKQFAMIGPATNTRVEVGLNHKSLGSSSRLIEQPSGSMCNYIVKLTRDDEVDDELIAWIRQAYDNTG